MNELNPKHNGFAILTGDKYIMIDLDLKHNPPQEIYDCLYNNCKAVERTPGGYHFWFLNDTRTSHFGSQTEAYWNNKKISGLDIRNKGGIAYCCPTRYVNHENTLVRYTWIKGNLGLCEAMSTDVLEHLHYEETSDDDVFTFTVTQGRETLTITHEEDDMVTVLNNYSQQRVDSYHDWVSVGMALKASGYSCELWDEWSKRSSKYKSGECFKKWASFHTRERPLSKGSLYQWLKEDNYEVFLLLQGNNKDLHNKFLIGTHASIAEAFYELNPYKYLFSNVNGWYCLQDNQTWLATGSKDVSSIPDILNVIRQECSSVLCDMLHSLNKEKDASTFKLIGDTVKKLGNTSFLKGVAIFLQGLYYIKDIEKEFNEKRSLFAFTDCVIDMSTHTIRPIQHDDYITITCGYPYRSATETEKATVMEFLEKVFPNPSVRSYILMAISLTFEGYNRNECFHVWTGLGANGKSCLIDLCQVVFGNYFQTLSVTYLTKDDDGKKDRPLPELASARYVRMLVASEPEEKDKFQVALLKLLTGNDEVSFRGMFEKKTEKYVPQYKLWIPCNDLPRLSKYDQGIERRLRLVHFPTRFVDTPHSENEFKKDVTLKEKIKGESWRYGFLNILLDSAKQMNGASLVMPEAVKQVTESYLLENNPVGAWLKKYYTVTNSRQDCVKKTDLFNTFLVDTNISISQKKFYEDMVKCNITDKKVDGIRYYIGLLRKDEIDETE